MEREKLNLKRKVFILIFGFFLILSFSNSLAWFDVTYPYRYKITANATSGNNEYPLAINDSSGVGGHIYWGLINGSTNNYVYCKVAGCKTDLIAIANDTTQKCWENENDNTGNCIGQIFGSTAVAVYHFGQQGKTIDSVNGLSNNSITYNKYAKSPFNNSVSFDGTTSAEVIIPDNALLNLAGSYTISLWLNMTVDASGQAVVKASGSKYNYQIAPRAGRVIQIQMYDGVGNPYCTGSTALTLNTWYHVAVVYSKGATMKLYINGKEDCSTIDTIVGSPLTSSPLEIGGGLVGETFQGSIDEVRIYNNTKTVLELQQEYWSGINNYTSTGAEENNIVLAPTTTNLWLNGTQGNITIVYGQNVNITAKINVTNLWIGLSRDGTLFNNDTTLAYNMTNINWFKNGTYAIRAFYSGNGTYSASEATYYLKVLKQPVTFNLTINGTESDKSYIFPQVSNITAYANGFSTSITLLRNGTSITNPNVNSYGAYLYNFTAVFSNENYTADSKTYWLTISKANSNLAIASSSGWSLTSGDYTALNCNVLAGLGFSFTLDSNIITNPYILQTQTGNYLVSCTLTGDTYNYTPTVASNTIVVNPVLACTGSNLYGFNKTITSDGYLTTLNFTDLVNQHYVRTNLGDVYVNTNNTHYINTTNGYYFIVNNTGFSTFTVSFGNYYANRTYAYRPLNESNIQNVSGYLQNHPVAIYNVLDELNGTVMYPPNTTLMSIITCSYGENYIPIENGVTNFLLAVRGYLSKASLRVSYTADMYYSRQFYPNVSADMTIFNFYTIDAYKNALDRIDFKMLDVNYYGVKLQIYKSFGSTKIMITECFFDASHYCSAYLMEDSDYLLRTIDYSNAITEFGTISVVKPDTKELGNVYIMLNPNAILIANNIYMNAYMNADRSTLYVTYNDNLNLTQSLRLKIFFENGTLFQNLVYTTTNHLNTNFDTSAYNSSSFVVRFNITHSKLGNSPITYDLSLLAPVAWSLGTSVIMYNLFSLGLLVTIGGLGTKTSLIPSSILLVAIYLTLMGLGWISAPAVLLIVVVVLLILNVISHVKAGNET